MEPTVHVDERVCQGTGYCERVAPSVFRVVDGIAQVIAQPTGDDLEATEEAERLCPSRAITL